MVGGWGRWIDVDRGGRRGTDRPEARRGLTVRESGVEAEGGQGRIIGHARTAGIHRKAAMPEHQKHKRLCLRLCYQSMTELAAG